MELFQNKLDPYVKNIDKKLTKILNENGTEEDLQVIIYSLKEILSIVAKLFSDFSEKLSKHIVKN
jgi:hypothetical protein|tara:strand:+ start:65 stop:259 length:195 start_codon:yes stop_codon:yes gene_type:complete